MIINITYQSEAGFQNTLGTFDTMKNRLTLFYSESRLGPDKKKFWVMYPGKPGPVEEVLIVDLDYDARYACTYKDFKKFKVEDDKVFIDLDRMVKVR